MSDLSRSPDFPLGRPAPSANDRLKDQWGRRLAWSLVFAVLLHSLVFSLSPEWTFFERAEVDRLGAASGAINVTRLLPAGGLAATAPATPVGERPDSTAEESAREAASGGEKGVGEGTVYTQDELWSRLDRADRPALALTEPSEPAVEELEPDVAEEERARSHGTGRGPSIGGSATTIGVADSSDDDAPEFGRLRSLRPEVVTGLASSEVLLRNPSEVVEFKKFAARRRPAVATTHAVVGVAVWVDRNGSVEWAEVSESTGSDVLDETALTLFRRVVAFRPALEDGERVPKSMLFYILFPW